jgi:hypothetical protein
MIRSFRLACALLPLSLSLPMLAACASSEESESEDAREVADSTESELTTAEKQSVCNAIPSPRRWTESESDRLLNEVVSRFVKLKRDNDALIATRGVGQYAGTRSQTYKATLEGRVDEAAARIAPYVKDGSNPRAIAENLRGTSCIGRVYSVLKGAYAAIGRSSEWAAVEKCGRAWDSDGLNVQQALIKNGWNAPALGFITDSKVLPGSAAEQDLHRGLLRGVLRGSYYGVPLARSTVMKDFLPTAGGATVRDDSVFMRLGKSKFLAVGTLRAAYHVPVVVPAAYIPADLAPASGSARTSWLAAKAAGEPFVLESHSLREVWDPTNFEIRPFREVISETLGSEEKYLSGTLLFAPFSSFSY